MNLKFFALFKSAIGVYLINYLGKKRFTYGTLRKRMHYEGFNK
jgi:hypothetical protein